MKVQKLQYWVLTTDLLWILGAGLFAHLLRYGQVWSILEGDSSTTVFLPVLVVSCLWVTVFFWIKLDGFQHGWNLSTILSQLFVAVGFVMLAALASGYLCQVFVSRLLLTYFGMLLFVGFSAIRQAAHAILSSRYFASAIRRVVIVGDDAVALEMQNKIQSHPEMLRHVVGFLCSADSPYEASIHVSHNRGTTVQTLGVVDLLREARVDEVIIAQSTAGVRELLNLAVQCRRQGIAVGVVPYPYELYLSRPQLLNIGGLPIVQFEQRRPNEVNAVLKRNVDLILGLTLLVISAPISLLGAIALLRRRGGPFCREERCGQYGALFYMWRLNSDRDASGLPWYEILLQRLSITELPQLWNVLRGEMSLVGPRPESPDRVKHYSDWQRQRLNVKPGMTGLAQVHGLREQHSSDEKARFDLQYILNNSFFFDISLLSQTVLTLIGRLVRIGRLVSPVTGGLREEPTDRFLERNLPSVDSAQSSAD